MNFVRAVALDFDGVLTDGTFFWGTGGEEFKQISFLDIMGISLGTKAGLLFAIISGENSQITLRLADKMGINDIFLGCKDKAAALKLFAQRNGLDLSEICFMGDDVNDLPALELAGLSVAPANAHKDVKLTADMVLNSYGGQGAVRELIDHLLSAQNRIESPECEISNG